MRSLWQSTGQKRNPIQAKKAMTKVMVIYLGDMADLEERPNLKNNFKLQGSIKSKEMCDVIELMKSAPDWV